jgi:hypothetical protein
LDHIPTVLILSQDAFYRWHNDEEIKRAFSNDLDLGESARSVRSSFSSSYFWDPSLKVELQLSIDHPDAIDSALFASVS